MRRPGSYLSEKYSFRTGAVLSPGRRAGKELALKLKIKLSAGCRYAENSEKPAGLFIAELTKSFRCGS